ncbi:MAG: TfoX/Sxy family protein [Bacteroidia bacterium]|nr:TfoX/Sxy family protein [Bacteroidia bacterium]
MAYNEELAERISKLLKHLEINYEEKKMFGGIAFMINEKMCIGLAKNQLMLRVMDNKYEELVQMDGAKEMDFTGRSLKGFIYVDPDAIIKDIDLKQWIDYGIEFGLKGELKTKKKKK